MFGAGRTMDAVVQTLRHTVREVHGLLLVSSARHGRDHTVPMPNALVAAFTTSTADNVFYGGLP